MKKLSLDIFQKLAEERGGKCLSNRYINSYTKLKWQCSKKHIWEAKPSAIKNNYSWCPKCIGIKKSSIYNYISITF